MKAFISSREANSVEHMLGADISIPVMLTDDDGVPEDISAATITAEFIIGLSRDAAPVKTLSLTARVIRGFTDIVIADSEGVLTRQSYYVWLKTSVAGTVKIASSPSIITLK